MLVVIISWIYIFLVCILIGLGSMKSIEKLIGTTENKTATKMVVAGIVVITVFAEIFSIFYKIGAIAHFIVLLTAILFGYLYRKDIYEMWNKGRKIVFSWEGFFYLGLILVIAFFTSRGEFHTDTGIYHGQAIRWYEEYGVVKGLGNVQLHYAYNSAYLAFSSVFSLFWMFGKSLHTTTGFMEMVMCIYACHGLKEFKAHKSHMADLCKIAILFYLLVIITGSMSPATDYAAMIMALYVITRWAETAEGTASIYEYALLSVLAVYVTSIKLSAGCLVLLAVYPAIYLFREKNWKKIGIYLGLGTLVIAPYLIRNVIISGWLVYPFGGIDLFSVDWKIPKAYLVVDSNQIKVWGRCLYDIAKIDMPVKDWLPIWWEAQERYAKMLIYAMIFGSLLGFVNLIHKLIYKIKINAGIAVLYGILFFSIAMWFFTAPFIRYGLGFLLALPLLSVGGWLNVEKRGIFSIATGVFVLCIVFTLSPYWDHYVTDAGVFAKHNAKEPYYIVQKDYDRAEVDEMQLNGISFYVSADGEIISYYDFPGTCYAMMLDRTQMRGDTIAEGFKQNKENELSQM